MKRLFRIGMALIATMLFLNACDVEKEPYIQGAEDERFILEFKVDSVYGTVDEDNKMVRLDFPAGTDVTHLTPTIIISNYATIEPKSGVTQDFTNPVYYTVTAMSGATAQYMVEAIVHDADNEKSILSFRFDALDEDGIIDEVARRISFVLPAETDVTQLVPTIEVSEGATVEPASGVAQDFTNPVTYTVTAQNGTTAAYTVMVIVEGGDVEPTGKMVLIKDFTGARCVNCPAAAEYAHNLQHQLDEDHIFIMSVHAGFLAQPMGQFPNFLTDEGTEWYNNHDSNPLFTVDHVALTDGNSLKVEQIDTPVVTALDEEQSFEIVIGRQFDPTSRQLQVNIQAVSLTDRDGHFFITACLVEDNIVGWQIIPGGTDKEYVFHNVFRGTLNGAYGESFEDHHVDSDDTFSFSYNTEINADYNADECYVVVYVYDRNQGDKILQTAVKKIK
ncbi:MAG: DUF5018 domain-containing protein [Bacteroidales bacterium]|nr:DUF5018 domain-containing protein [Bacteroidales bacterium]